MARDAMGMSVLGLALVALAWVRGSVGAACGPTRCGRGCVVHSRYEPTRGQTPLTHDANPIRPPVSISSPSRLSNAPAMSEAVRAAVAARRAAAARSRSTSPVKKRGEDDGGSGSGASGFGSFDQPFDRRGSPTLSTHSASSFSLAQKPEEDLLYQSCSSGKLNLSSRLPALTSLPTIVFSLLDGAPPRWYEDKNEQNDPQSRRPWYEREDLRILSVANGELSEISDRIGDFRGLSKLEVRDEDDALASRNESMRADANLLPHPALHSCKTTP